MNPLLVVLQLAAPNRSTRQLWMNVRALLRRASSKLALRCATEILYVAEMSRNGHRLVLIYRLKRVFLPLERQSLGIIIRTGAEASHKTVAHIESDGASHAPACPAKITVQNCLNAVRQTAHAS